MEEEERGPRGLRVTPENSPVLIVKIFIVT